MYYLNKDNGISTFTSANQVAASFNSCSTNAKNLIPVEQINSTSIILGATAGMRLLKLVYRQIGILKLTFMKKLYYLKPH